MMKTLGIINNLSVNKVGELKSSMTDVREVLRTLDNNADTALAFVHGTYFSLTHSLTRLLTRLLTHLLTYSLTHSLTHLLTHLLTHSLT